MDRWSRDQPQPGSLFQSLREAEKRDPGNEVGVTSIFLAMVLRALAPSARAELRYYFNDVPFLCSRLAMAENEGSETQKMIPCSKKLPFYKAVLESENKGTTCISF